MGKYIKKAGDQIYLWNFLTISTSGDWFLGDGIDSIFKASEVDKTSAKPFDAETRAKDDV